jgi:hypothetical protein
MAVSKEWTVIDSNLIEVVRNDDLRIERSRGRLPLERVQTSSGVEKDRGKGKVGVERPLPLTAMRPTRRETSGEKPPHNIISISQGTW